MYIKIQIKEQRRGYFAKGMFKFKCLLGPFMFKSINNKEKTSNTVTVSYNLGSGPFDYSVTG